MFSLIEEIRLNHAASVQVAPTVARYLAFATDGTVTATGFAWDDPADRNGDGEAEADGYLEFTGINGFAVTEVTGEFPVGPGIPGDIPGDSLRVYRATDGAGDVQYFALAVVPTDIYWDRDRQESVTI